MKRAQLCLRSCSQTASLQCLCELYAYQHLHVGEFGPGRYRLNSNLQVSGVLVRSRSDPVSV